MSLRAAWVRFAAFYRGLSLFVTNVLVLLVLAYLSAWAWFSLRPASYGRWARGELGDLATRVYPGQSEADVTALLAETWSRPVEYQPFTEFKEREHKGRFVNVSAEGFRHVKDQGPWPPARDRLNVFVFGGSTTFGYGIADDETIASFLQEALRGRTPRSVSVYNFGCNSYYSSRERAQFQQLILAGFVPDLAVFVDGLNEFHFRREWSPISSFLHIFVEQRGAQRRRGLPPWLTLFSPARLAAEIRAHRRSTEPRSKDPQEADHLIDRYLHNKKMIEAVAEAYGVRAFFVWQPVSAFKFDWKRHHRPQLETQIQPLPGVGSERMAERLKREPPPPNFISLAEIHADVPDPLYVDGVHYAPNLCRAIAQHTADAMEGRGFLRAATGSAASGR
jgi:hypothetical protein